MWAAVLSPVGESRVPAIMTIFSPETGSQKRLDPQFPQNPRRAVSDDGYHRKPSDAMRARFSGRAAVAATKWLLVRRHCEQWYTE